MRSLSSLMLVVVCGAVVCFSSPALATTIFQDNFDLQSLGTSVVSLDPPIGVGYTGSSGSDVVTIANTWPGISSNATRFISDYTCTNGTSKLWNEDAAATATQVVTYGFDAWIYPEPGITSGTTIYAYGGGGASAVVFLSAAGTLMYNDGAEQLTAGTAVSTGEWFSVELTVDYNAKTWTGTVDGIDIGGAFNEASTRSDYLYIQTAASRGFAFDNVTISIVPEPSTLAILVTGLLGLLAYAWRKWR